MSSAFQRRIAFTFQKMEETTRHMFLPQFYTEQEDMRCSQALDSVLGLRNRVGYQLCPHKLISIAV
jgi:hypothetical protein